MKNIDKIILYMDGQMSEDEKASFEKEVASSEELQKEFTSYKQMLNKFSDLKTPLAEEDYFVNMSARFRANFEAKKSRSLMPKLALGISTLVAIFVVIMVTSSNRNSLTGSNNDSSLTSYSQSVYTDMVNYTNQLSIDDLTQNAPASYDSVLNTMLTSAITNSSQQNGYIQTLVNSDVNSLVSVMSDEEANQIYNEMIKKDFSKGL